MTSEWISVKDGLPDGGFVLVHGKNVGFGDCPDYTVASTGWVLGGVGSESIDGWMPLPPPPEDAVRTALNMVRFIFEDIALAQSHVYGHSVRCVLDAIARAEKELDK